MNIAEFKEGLIALIQMEDYADKVKLLEIINVSEMIFEQTGDFALRYRQCWEYLTIRVPIPLLTIAKQHQKYLNKKAYEIYIETNDYDLKEVLIKPGAATVKGILSSGITSIHFEDIQDQVLAQIKNANYSIWAAIAWVTDPIIIQALLQKNGEGVNVRLIVNNDAINSRTFSLYEDKIEVTKVDPKGYYSNIMHNKFCIIDFKTVIAGSYNWTRKAEYNNETIEIKTNVVIAEQYADHFKKLFVDNN
jgi:phosphatidylserine/phosphatidylglycerophosphate/cardiolipin synthase-like enzyme